MDIVPYNILSTLQEYILCTMNLKNSIRVFCALPNKNKQIGIVMHFYYHATGISTQHGAKGLAGN